MFVLALCVMKESQSKSMWVKGDACFYEWAAGTSALIGQTHVSVSVVKYDTTALPLLLLLPIKTKLKDACLLP